MAGSGRADSWQGEGDGDVNFSKKDRRYLNMLRPPSAGGYNCWIRPGYYSPFLLLHLIPPVRMDGWVNLRTSAGRMLHSVYPPLYLRYWIQKQTRNASGVKFLALFGNLFIVLCSEDSKDLYKPEPRYASIRLCFTPAVQFIRSWQVNKKLRHDHTPLYDQTPSYKHELMLSVTHSLDTSGELIRFYQDYLHTYTHMGNILVCCTQVNFVVGISLLFSLRNNDDENY